MSLKTVRSPAILVLTFGCIQWGLTFDSDKDGLLDEELRLDEDAADVGTLVHPLLNIAQLQGSVLKHHLHKHSIVTAGCDAMTVFLHTNGTVHMKCDYFLRKGVKLFLQITHRYVSIALSDMMVKPHPHHH